MFADLSADLSVRKLIFLPSVSTQKCGILQPGRTYEALPLTKSRVKLTELIADFERRPERAFSQTEIFSIFKSHSFGNLRGTSTSLKTVGENIARAAASFRASRENPPVNKFQYVAVRRVLRRLRELGPFRGGQFAFEAIEQLVQDQTLSVVHLRRADPLPKPRFPHHVSERYLRPLNRPAQAAEEPRLPWRNVRAALLSRCQFVVVVIPL